jgi:peptide/nickel transport system substrate-binding protein
MTAPLPRHYLSRFPMADQVNGAGFRTSEIAQLPVPGPFKYESVTPQAALRLVRNDQYQNPRTGKPAYLDSVAFRWYPDAAAMIPGFRAGQIDLAFDLEDADIPTVQDLGRQVVAIPGLEYEFLRLNWSPASAFDATKQTGGCSRNPAVQDRGKGCPVADPAIRQAIAMAIDKDAVNSRLLGGNVRIANTDISPSAWFFADQASPPFDPAKAGSILDAAGWAPGPDGVRAKNGLKARIELCTTTDQVRRDTLALVHSWLRTIGIDSIIRAVPATDIFVAYSDARLDTPCALSRSNFDLAEHAFKTSIDPLGDYFSYHSSQFRPIGANDAQVNDPAIDRALETVRSTVDFALVRDAMATFQKVYVDKTVEIPLYYRRNVELVGPRVGNYLANGTSAGSTWNGEDWYVRS